MTYGTWQLAGVQSGTGSGGEVYLGPYAVAFGSAQKSIPFVVNTTATVPVPTGALGVCIVPPIGNTTPSLSVKTVSGDTGIRIAPGGPTLIEFDSAAVPSNIYLVSGSNVTVQLIFT